jgi:hypothetical protein
MAARRVSRSMGRACAAVFMLVYRWPDMARNETGVRVGIGSSSSCLDAEYAHCLIRLRLCRRNQGHPDRNPGRSIRPFKETLA